MNSDSDLWYLWVAFDVTFLVLAIEVAITVSATRKHRRRHRVIQAHASGGTLIKRSGERRKDWLQ